MDSEVDHLMCTVSSPVSVELTTDISIVVSDEELEEAGIDPWQFKMTAWSGGPTPRTTLREQMLDDFLREYAKDELGL